MTIFSPYVYGWVREPTPEFRICNLEDVSQHLHHDLVTLAFVVDDRFSEIEGWIPDIQKFQGRVIISFGGANGSYPSNRLSVKDEFERACELLVASGVRAIDYDIEGITLSDKSQVTQIVQIAQLICQYFQSRGESLYISLTLPIEFSSGLNKFAVQAINLFKSHHIPLSIINAMIMDYYTPLPENTTWGQENVRILSIMHTQLHLIYPDIPKQDIWKLMGVCPMIGENDDETKFTLEDMKLLLEFVKSKEIGLVSFWALNRDQVALPGQESTVYSHSNCNSKDFEYSQLVIDMGLNDPFPY